jgi:hypothetical protein
MNFWRRAYNGNEIVIWMLTFLINSLPVYVTFFVWHVVDFSKSKWYVGVLFAFFSVATWVAFDFFWLVIVRGYESFRLPLLFWLAQVLMMIVIAIFLGRLIRKTA